eukprot:5890527-Prorocentrum_lima.AAC.1
MGYNHATLEESFDITEKALLLVKEESGDLQMLLTPPVGNEDAEEYDYEVGISSTATASG